MTKTETVAAILIKTLNHLQVDHFFATPGSEFGPIILEFSDSADALNIQPHLCAHEFSAVSMAYGAYCQTHRPQAVMTHANVGLANALIGLIGAHRMNIPMILIAGQTSQLERDPTSGRDRIIHWSQDSQNPEQIFKDYVKSTLTISHESQVVDAVHRAHTLSLQEPQGPVALSISRDLLEKKFLFDSKSLERLKTSVYSSGLSIESRNLLYQRLEKSQKPVLISNRLEKKADLSPIYSELLEKHSIACLRPEVFYQQGSYFQKTDLTDHKTEVLNEADLILVLDTDAPWVPLNELQNHLAHVIHIGPDPLFTSIPFRSHQAHEVITASVDSFFKFLQSTPTFHSAERKKWLNSHLSSIQLKKTDLFQSLKMTDPQQKNTFQSVAHDLSELIPPNSVLVNELSLPQKNLQLKESIRYYRSGAASPLGWGLGFSLGHALHAPESIHYCVVGDGVFQLSPLSSLMNAVENKIAFVMIVLNNKKMQSVVAAAEKFSGLRKDHWPLTEFKMPFHYERTADLVDGLGLKVYTRQEFQTAFKKATEFTLNNRKPAIINIELKN